MSVRLTSDLKRSRVGRRCTNLRPSAGVDVNVIDPPADRSINVISEGTVVKTEANLKRRAAISGQVDLIALHESSIFQRQSRIGGDVVEDLQRFPLSSSVSRNFDISGIIRVIEIVAKERQTRGAD